MNRQIKFRGRVEQNDNFDGGRIVYGSLVIYADGLSTHWIYPIDGDRNYPVDRDSVSQLIATDRNGYEVYEGDPIKLADGWRCTATFRHFGAIADGDATLITEE